MKRRGWIVLAALVLLVLALVGYWYLREREEPGIEVTVPPGVDPVDESEEPVDEVAVDPVEVVVDPKIVVLAGLDQNYDDQGDPIEGYHYADTIVVAFLDAPERGAARLLVVPADTLITTGGYENLQIRTTYVLGGPDLLVEALSALLDQQVESYLVARYSGFVELVDFLEGVEVDVEREVRYADTLGGFSIDVSPGPQVLSGEEALLYVRFWDADEGELGRVQRQRGLVKALAAEALQIARLRDLPGMADVVRASVESNINLQDLLNLGRSVREIRAEKVEAIVVPGERREDGFHIGEGALSGVLDQILGD